MLPKTGGYPGTAKDANHEQDLDLQKDAKNEDEQRCKATIGRRMPYSKKNKKTVCEEPFPIVVMTMEIFLNLKTMESYEELTERGLLTDMPETGTIHFLSHQWLGFSHPDPEAVQLSGMQKVFRTISDGTAAELFTPSDWKSFAEKVSTESGGALRQAEASIANDTEFLTEGRFATHVSEGYVWLDYACVPQSRKGDGPMQQLAAIQSIPAYLERCDYFWILAPTARHVDTNELCSFATWRSRGWCRLEEWGNFLSVHYCAPLIVTSDPLLRTIGYMDFELACQGKPYMAPCAGAFSCCRMDHHITLPSGEDVPILCDKDIIASVLSRLFQSKRQHLHAMSNRMMYRFLVGLVEPMIFGGADDSWQPCLTDENEMLDCFLNRIGLESISDVGSPPISAWHLAAAHGNLAMLEKLQEVPEALQQLQDTDLNLGVLHWAAMQGRVEALRFLFDNSLCPVEVINNPRGAPKITALDRASKYGFPDAVALLVERRAAVNLRRTDGSSALHGAAGAGHFLCCRTLLESKADVHAQNAKGCTALHLASDPLTFYGVAEGKATVVKCLMLYKADSSKANNDGLSALDIAKDKQFTQIISLLSHDMHHEQEVSDSVLLPRQRRAFGQSLRGRTTTLF